MIRAQMSVAQIRMAVGVGLGIALRMFRMGVMVRIVRFFGHDENILPQGSEDCKWAGVG